MWYNTQKSQQLSFFPGNCPHHFSLKILNTEEIAAKQTAHGVSCGLSRVTATLFSEKKYLYKLYLSKLWAAQIEFHLPAGDRNHRDTSLTTDTATDSTHTNTCHGLLAIWKNKPFIKIISLGIVVVVIYVYCIIQRTPSNMCRSRLKD